MGQGLRVRVRGPTGVSDRTFPRLPLLIGRDPDAAQCCLDDAQVSKLHASLDVRNGVLCARDLGSKNGTYVGRRRLPPNQWVAVGPPEHGIDIQIADYVIEVSSFNESTNEAVAHSATLGELLAGFASAPGRANARASAPPPAASPPVGGPLGNDPVSRLGPLHANFVESIAALQAALVREIEAQPPAARARLCEHIARTYPALTNNPALQALLRSYGWPGSSAGTAANPLATVAHAALQELAAWYTGRDRLLTTPADVAAFKENLRSALDEFLMGYVPLVAGVAHFEERMAIQSLAHGRLPSSPVELARALMDWRQSNAGVRQQLRSAFAELMMHQVALLNAVMSGVKALLSELAPSAIEQEARDEQRGPGVLGRVFSHVDPWSVYKRRHSDLTDEENERFRVLFGREFAEEYRQYIRGGSGSTQ